MKTIKLTDHQWDFLSDLLDYTIREYFHRTHLDASCGNEYDIADLEEYVILAKIFGILPDDDDRHWIIEMTKAFDIEPWFTEVDKL